LSRSNCRDERGKRRNSFEVVEAILSPNGCSQSTLTYKSTRGGQSNLDFESVLFSTYAEDGGLFVPETMPTFSHEDLYSWKDMSFPEICAQVAACLIIIVERVAKVLSNVCYISLFR
jgi:hypothetical protein